MADKPTVQFSVAKLRKEVEVADTFRFAASGSKIITFPDMYAMESEEAETLFSKIRKDSGNWDLIREWLTKADAEALKAEKLPLIHLVKLIKTAVDYYEDFYGNPGEDTASAS